MNCMTHPTPNQSDEPVFHTELTTWTAARDELRAIREAVFIEEQKVPRELEWDGLDDTAVHVLARAADGRPIGTARMLADGRIGRMAVLATWRGRGVGSALLRALLAVAQERGLSPYLEAQTHAIPFYERFGFRAHGPVFDDAGIPHRHMRWTDPKPLPAKHDQGGNPT